MDSLPVRFGTLATLIPLDVLAGFLPDPPPPPDARATMEARITSALADMRQKVRGRLRGAARARFLACYEAALREAVPHE